MSLYQTGVLFQHDINEVQGKHRNEHYVTHFQVGTKIILISTYFVFRLTLKTIEGYQNLPSVKWKVPIRGIHILLFIIVAVY